MNDLTEQDEHDEQDDGVEVDWLPLQAAINAMSENGLEFTDPENLLNHLGVLFGAALKHIRDEHGADDEQVQMLAAEVAGFAADLVLDNDALPPFAPNPLKEV